MKTQCWITKSGKGRFWKTLPEHRRLRRSEGRVLTACAAHLRQQRCEAPSAVRVWEGPRTASAAGQQADLAWAAFTRSATARLARPWLPTASPCKWNGSRFALSRLLSWPVNSGQWGYRFHLRVCLVSWIDKSISVQPKLIKTFYVYSRCPYHGGGEALLSTVAGRKPGRQDAEPTPAPGSLGYTRLRHGPP